MPHAWLILWQVRLLLRRFEAETGAKRPWHHETNETRDDIGPKHRLAIATIINGLLARPAKSVGAKSQIFSEQ